ncbi:MAG: PAS domain-containing protein, partial [Salinisphaera sp.]|nr:PAS domain-containing protein [Salinisphaera sp.]
RFFPLALAQWRAWREGPDPVAEGPAALQPSAPAAAEPLAGSITNPFTDGLDVACLQLDGHGRIRSANLAAQALLDQPAGMLLGKSVDDVFAFADGNGLQVEGPASRCLRAEAGIDRERLWLQRPGQDALAVEACAAPASGGATMLLWPVAAAAGAQQSTDERASLAELALASLDQPLALVDAQGTVQLVNPAWAALGGHDAEMLVGVPLAWMLPQPFADTELTKSAQMAATFSGPGGSNRTITLKVQPVADQETAFLLRADDAGDSSAGMAAASQLRLALAQDGLALRLWPLLGPDGAVVAAWADPNWPGGGGLTGVALWQRAVQEDAAAELAGWLVEHSARAFADWRDIGLSPVPVLLPAGAAPLPAIAQAWTAVRDAMQLPAASLMLVLGHDDEQTPKLPAGMGLALVTDFSRPPPAQGYDLLVLSPELVASLPADENARQAALALAAFANQAQRALVAGPVERAEQSEALSRLGIDHCFGPAAGEVMSARAFGRYLARHPPAC